MDGRGHGDALHVSRRRGLVDRTLPVLLLLAVCSTCFHVSLFSFSQSPPRSDGCGAPTRRQDLHAGASIRHCVVLARPWTGSARVLLGLEVAVRCVVIPLVQPLTGAA